MLGDVELLRHNNMLRIRIQKLEAMIAELQAKLADCEADNSKLRDELSKMRAMLAGYYEEMRRNG